MRQTRTGTSSMHTILGQFKLALAGGKKCVLGGEGGCSGNPPVIGTRMTFYGKGAVTKQVRSYPVWQMAIIAIGEGLPGYQQGDRGG